MGCHLYLSELQNDGWGHRMEALTRTFCFLMLRCSLERQTGAPGTTMSLHQQARLASLVYHKAKFNSREMPNLQTRSYHFVARLGEDDIT